MKHKPHIAFEWNTWIKIKHKPSVAILQNRARSKLYQKIIKAMHKITTGFANISREICCQNF